MVCAAALFTVLEPAVFEMADAVTVIVLPVIDSTAENVRVLPQFDVLELLQSVLLQSNEYVAEARTDEAFNAPTAARIAKAIRFMRCSPKRIVMRLHGQ